MFIFWCISFLTAQSIAWGGWAHLYVVGSACETFFEMAVHYINIPINYFKTPKKMWPSLTHCINVVVVWSLVHIVVLSFPFSNL
jgi:hypothetical protein